MTRFILSPNKTLNEILSINNSINNSVSVNKSKRFDLMYRGVGEESEATEMVLAKESNEEMATNN